MINRLDLNESKDVLASIEGGDGEGRVVIIGRADVDDVDVGIVDQVVCFGG